MNFAQTNKLDQPARSEKRCGSCGRPWFGLVAYCPYCGREPGFTKISQEPRDRPQSDKPEREPLGTLLFKAAVVAIGALLLWMADKPAPKSDEGASAQPTATSAIASPGAGAGLPPGGAQLPSVPPPVEAAVPPPSNSPLCSVASEMAGLCKSQN